MTYEVSKERRVRKPIHCDFLHLPTVSFPSFTRESRMVLILERWCIVNLKSGHSHFKREHTAAIPLLKEFFE